MPIKHFSFSDFLTLHNIIMALIENGAHMDTVNQMGATPFDSATSGMTQQLTFVTLLYMFVKRTI